jgi:hypothetical protein
MRIQVLTHFACWASSYSFLFRLAHLDISFQVLRFSLPSRHHCAATLAEVEKDVEEHRYGLVLEAQEVGLFAQRYRVDQPRTQTEGQGNSGDGLHHKQAQVDLG